MADPLVPELEPELEAAADAIRRELVELERWGPGSEPALIRYVRARDLAERSWRQVPKKTVTAKGERGAQRRHPAHAAALEAEKAAAQFGQELGYEPKAAAPAAKPGRKRGEAHAPDRAARPGLRAVT